MTEVETEKKKEKELPFLFDFRAFSRRPRRRTASDADGGYYLTKKNCSKHAVLKTFRYLGVSFVWKKKELLANVSKCHVVMLIVPETGTIEK